MLVCPEYTKFYPCQSSKGSYVKVQRFQNYSHLTTFARCDTIMYPRGLITTHTTSWQNRLGSWRFLGTRRSRRGRCGCGRQRRWRHRWQRGRRCRWQHLIVFCKIQNLLFSVNNIIQTHRAFLACCVCYMGNLPSFEVLFIENVKYDISCDSSLKMG